MSPADWDPRMIALARPAAIVNERPILSSEKLSIRTIVISCKIKLLVVTLKGLVAKTN
jgi:hypothetical protein